MKLDFPDQQVDSVRVTIRARRVLWLLIPGALVFGLLAGISIGSFRGAPEPPKTTTAGQCRVTDAGLVVGCPQTEAGAASAAGSIVAVFHGPRMLNPAERQDAIRTYAAPGAEESLAALGEGVASDYYSVAYGNTQRGAAGMLQCFPQMWMPDGYTGDTARIVVWQAVVMNGPNLQIPKVFTGGDVLSLEWHDGWKLRSIRDARLPKLPGDTSGVPTTADVFAQQMRGFRPFYVTGGAR